MKKLNYRSGLIFLILFQLSYGIQFNPIALGTHCPRPQNIAAFGFSNPDKSYTLIGQGNKMYDEWDKGAFACIKTNSDTFTFIVRIKNVKPSIYEQSTYGICVREGVRGNERAIHLRFDNFTNQNCWTWFTRTTPSNLLNDTCFYTSPSSITCEGKDTLLKDSSDVYLRIKKMLRRYKLAISKDKNNWIKIGGQGSLARIYDQKFAPLENDFEFSLESDTVYIGLVITSGKEGQPQKEVTFDNITFTGMIDTNSYHTEKKWYVPVKSFKPLRRNEHPRLFFRSTDIPELQKRANSPEGKKIINHLYAQLGNMDSMVYSDDTPDNLRGPRKYPLGTYTLWHAAGFGFLYQLTKDTLYAHYAKKCVDTALAGQIDRDRRYSLYKPGASLRAAPSLAAIAMAYDLCYSAWPKNYRKMITQKIMYYSAMPLNKEGQHDSLTLKNMSLAPRHMPGSNHYGCFVGGAGISLLSILGDDGINTDSVNYYLSFVERNAINLLQQGFGDHGWFSEGQGPGNIPQFSGFLNYLQALRNTLGKDFISASTNAQWLALRPLMEIVPHQGKPNIPNRVLYNLTYGTDDLLGLDRWLQNYMLLSSSGHFSEGFGTILDSQKSSFLWIYENFVNGSDPFPYNTTYYPHRSILALVNWPFTIKPENPALYFPKVLQDKRKGYYVFRNRWANELDIVVTLLLGSEPFSTYRDIGPEPIMVQGLGIKTEFPGIIKQAVTSFFEPNPDGSGVVSCVPLSTCSFHLVKGTPTPIIPEYAPVNSFGVDYSKTSGADALLVMVGPDAGKYINKGRIFQATPKIIKGHSNTIVKSSFVKANSIEYVYMTLGYDSQYSVTTNGDTLKIGNQSVYFDGKRLHFAQKNHSVISNMHESSKIQIVYKEPFVTISFPSYKIPNLIELSDPNAQKIVKFSTDTCQNYFLKIESKNLHGILKNQKVVLVRTSYKSSRTIRELIPIIY